MSNAALKTVPPRAKPPARSPERERLATAIARRTAAAIALDGGRRALTRAGDVVQKAAARATDAAHALTKASEDHAAALAEAAVADVAPPPNPKRQAREVEADAQDQLAAAQAAHATVKARLGDLEDDARAATSMVISAVNAVIRSHAAEILAEAEALAARLHGLRCILCFMASPEVSAGDALSTPRRDPLSEDWQSAVRQFGRDRADRRARDDWQAQRARDEGFAETKAAVQKFLGGGVLSDARWNTDASVAPWQAARAAMLAGDADAPLPLPK